MHDRKDDVRDVGREALGNKASQPRERCPRGQRRRCFARDSASMDGLKRKNSQGRDPRTQECEEHSQPQAKQQTITIRIEVSQTQITLRDDRGADDSDSVQRSEAQQSQFKENIVIPASAQREAEFGRSWRNLHYSAMMKKKIEQQTSVFRRLRRCCRLSPLEMG